MKVYILFSSSYTTLLQNAYLTSCKDYCIFEFEMQSCTNNAAEDLLIVSTHRNELTVTNVNKLV